MKYRTSIELPITEEHAQKEWHPYHLCTYSRECAQSYIEKLKSTKGIEVLSVEEFRNRIVIAIEFDSEPAIVIDTIPDSVDLKYVNTRGTSRL